MAEWQENKLYAQWLESDPADRGPVEAKLYAEVKRHTRAVLWNKLDEEPPDELIDKATAAVMTDLGRFRKEAKFSTWVHAVADRKAKEYQRGKVRAREVFDEYTEVVESHEEDFLERRAGEVIPSEPPHVEAKVTLRQLRESLSDEEAKLLQQKEEGLSSKEIAEETKTTVEAVDSQWARIKESLKKPRVRPREKKFPSKRRK